MSSANIKRKLTLLPKSLRIGLLVAILAAGAVNLLAIITNLTLVADLHEPQAEHADQQEFYDLVVAGMHEEAFELAFEEGDELFETVFNALDGVGANVGQGQRFTRVPRADLNGPHQWANHFPARATGPNAEACNQCHNQPFDDGAGGAAATVHRDPLHSASLGSFIERNTPHVFAPGALQRLAEEMTEDLHAIRRRAVNRACSEGGTVTRDLTAKGVDFGKIRVTKVSSHPCEVDIDTSHVEGVDEDLVVKPFQWKGVVASVRDFNRGASHNELGMQAVEITGDGVDGDFDGVADEMTIGDQTALAVYLSAQPRPTSLLELHSLGLVTLEADQIDSIRHGFQVFRNADCNSCHRPNLKIENPIFSEPSQNPNFRDETFPAGQDPVSRLVDPVYPVTFDLTQDQPDNVLEIDGEEVHLGSLRTDELGRAVVDLFGDLKRHDMGARLAETIDEAGTGASVWITKELWGVGSTGPYLHDGRATTVTEAILEHGGEALASRNAFLSLPLGDQEDLVAFLNNLVLFKTVEE